LHGQAIEGKWLGRTERWPRDAGRAGTRARCRYGECGEEEPVELSPVEVGAHGFFYETGGSWMLKWDRDLHEAQGRHELAANGQRIKPVVRQHYGPFDIERGAVDRQPVPRAGLDLGQIVSAHGALTENSMIYQWSTYLRRFALGVVPLVATAVVGAAQIAAAQGGPPPAPAVTVANPLAKRITNWDEYSGRFQAVQRVEVRPRVSGFIDTIHFKDGQMVKAGDLLFTIDPRPFELALDSAKAEVARANAQVELASTEVERARPLVRSGAVTERDFDQRAANLLVARAALQAAQAAAKNAELNLEWTKVTAAIDGRLSDRKVDAGNLVTGGSGTTTLLATIVTMDPIHFVFEVSEADYLRYTRLAESGKRESSRNTGNPVRIKLSDETEFKHQGKMDFVDNALNARSGTMRGRAVVENKSGLMQPGLFARMQLFGGEVDGLLIPDAAVVADQARKIVFTVGEDGIVKPKPVTLGAIHGGLRVVLSGLTPADRVVIDGIANPMVRPGAKVTAQDGQIEMVAN
jgi:RND family efflux transporter MFP subunit